MKTDIPMEMWEVNDLLKLIRTHEGIMAGQDARIKELERDVAVIWPTRVAKCGAHIVVLEAIVDRFVCYHESGVGQLTHILAAAEAAKKGAGT